MTAEVLSLPRGGAAGPAPLVPIGVDVRDAPDFRFNIARMLDSDWYHSCSTREALAGINLHARAIHQVPAGSLPGADGLLARLADFGRDVDGWHEVKAKALEGWVLCADGRWYHPDVARNALHIWIGRLEKRRASAIANLAQAPDRDFGLDEITAAFGEACEAQPGNLVEPGEVARRVAGRGWATARRRLRSHQGGARIGRRRHQQRDQGLRRAADDCRGRANMSSVASLAVASRAAGPPADALTGCFQAVAVHGGRLAVALLNRDPERIAGALDEARQSLAWAESRNSDVLAALKPVTDDEIEVELTRLVRAWPQDKRGDLAGYGAELTLFVLELRPSRRALEQACRALKLGRVHLPSIAEVMTALKAAEGALAAAVQQLAALPDRIARAEAELAQPPKTLGSSTVAERRGEPLRQAVV